MLFSLIMSIQFAFIATEAYDAPVFQQSVQNQVEHVWHSYTFNTGAGNREEVHFSNVELTNNFKSSKNVFMWRSIQIDEEVAIVGVGNNFLHATICNKEIDSVTHLQELEGSPIGLTLFQKWNAKAQQVKSFALVAVKAGENNYLLKWFEIFNGSLKLVWDWPFYKTVTHLDVIKIGHESKLLIISHNNKTYKSLSADIYNFNMNEIVDIWLFEKIILDDVPSSVTVFDTNDNVFFSASFPSLQMVHIFRYSKSICPGKSEQKHFVSHQKIYKIGLKSLISFRVGFRWYLAIASESSALYHVAENFLFQPVSGISLSSLNFWLAIPFDSYREDVILLADSSSDVSLIAWTGDENFGVIGSFSKLACGNDTNCLEKMKNASLNHSTAFNFNGHQNILMSVENEMPLMFKFFIKLKPVPDKILARLNEILKEKNILEVDFNNQNSQISQLRENKKEHSERVKSVIFTAPTIEGIESPEAESQTKNWTEIISTVDNLKAKIVSLNADIRKFQRDLKSNMSYQNEPKSMSELPRNVPEGITFHGNVLINDLDVSLMNGHDISEILKNSYRKNKIQKLNGKKTLRKLHSENVMFEKLGEMLACDIVFSDDLCEEENKNLINGNIVLENNLNVLNEVKLTKPTTNYKSHKPVQKRSTLRYDTLNFDELEINEETSIQGNINGELFIVPVHNIHLNILDTVNQARIEVVNVEQNLDVGFINGKNVSQIFSEVIIKGIFHPRNETIRINGTFSTPALEVNKINNFDLGSKISEFIHRDGQKQPNHPVENRLANKLKTLNLNLKRTVHVFQNLEINGTLLSDRINNISWTVLKDTVKKGEKNVSLCGLKKFQKVLKAPEIISEGTVNGRFIENVMTNFSDQVIWFPQIFENVKFNNLSIEGSWDGVYVDQLDKSFYHLSHNNNNNSNVVFKDECIISELHVTESINGLSLTKKSKKLLGDKLKLKNLKAQKATLHGSLITNNKINQVNLTNFDLLRVSLKSPESIERDMSHYNITVGGDLNLKTLNLNDVTDVINSGGSTNLIEQFLNGDIHRIRKLLVKGLVRTSNGINGFNLTRVFEKGVRIAKPNAMKGNITFENIVNFNDINVTDSIDGFSLKKLEKDIVLRQSQIFLNAGKNFSTLKVTKNMKARTLNGHFLQEVVTLKGDHNMKGLVSINGDVIVRGNITSYSAINNITVPDLLRTFSTKFNSYIYSGDLRLESEKITINNLILGGDVQSSSLETVINDAVKKHENFKISGKKSFNGKVTFKGNILVENFTYGLNFSNFYADAVFINEPFKHEGTIKMEEAVLKVLEVLGDFNSKLINRVDTDDWFEESIPLDKYEIVSGKKTFESAVVMQDVSVNFINNHLPSAMISLKKKQHIPVSVLFPKLNSLADVTVSGSVNGRNLVKEFQDTVLTYGIQTVSGRILFSNEFTVNGNLYVDTIGTRKVNDLITLDTDQKIRTPLKFEGLVTAKNNVENLKIINDVDIKEWNEKSVGLNRQQVLRGFWTVKGSVKTRNINGSGLLYKISLPNISKDVQDGKLMALEIKNETEMDYETQCRKIEKLSERLFQLPYLFHQFEMTQEIETSSVIDSVITLKINNEDYLIVSFINNCNSLLYKWDKENSLHVYIRQLNIGPVSKWIVAYLNQATYVVTVSLKSSITCEENLQQSNVWIFNGNHDRYAHIPFENRFVDIVQENTTSAEFFSLNENGDLYRWTLGESLNVTSKFLLNIGKGNYKFIDFRITKGLAVANNREIHQYKINGNEVNQSNFLFFNSQIVALPIEGKVLTAVIHKDKVVVYENVLEDKIFSVIHVYKPGSAVWYNFGSEKQAFLIIASQHKLIEVFEYKGVSGFVKTASFQIFSSKLQSVILPSNKKYQVNRFLTVIQRKKLVFLRADMLGDFWEKEDSLC